MSSPNTTFGGSIAANYDKYLVPLIFEDYAQDLVHRAPMPSEGHILEIAAGTGALTRQLRLSLPEDVLLTATDANQSMLELAGERLADSHALSFGVADGTALGFADESFNTVFCQFGVMFYGDHSQGFREAARVLKPGGSFVFNVWDSLDNNRLAAIVQETVKQLFPDDPPLFMSVPFGYNNLSEIRGELEQAGFAGIEISVKPGVSRSATHNEAAMGLVAGSPLGATLKERGLLEITMQAVEAAMEREFGPAPLAAPMQAISFVARRP